MMANGLQIFLIYKMIDVPQFDNKKGHFTIMVKMPQIFITYKNDIRSTMRNRG